jgi:hypothetical protein
MNTSQPLGQAARATIRPTLINDVPVLSNFREDSVEAANVKLNNAQEQLQSAVFNLLSALDPVLCDTPQAPAEKSPTNPPIGQSQAARFYHQKAAEFFGIARQLQDIQERLTFK